MFLHKPLRQQEKYLKKVKNMKYNRIKLNFQIQKCNGTTLNFDLKVLSYKLFFFALISVYSTVSVQFHSNNVVTLHTEE